MQAHSIAAFSREKSLGYTTAATFEEYLADTTAAAVLCQRMAEVRIGPDEQLFFTTYPDSLHWVIVVADDSPDTVSPDTVAVLPVLVHLAQCSWHIDVRIAQADAWDGYLRLLVDDPDLLANLADIDPPLLLIFDEDWRYVEQWGPHPEAIEPYLELWLTEHPDFDALADDDSPAGTAAYRALLAQLTHTMRLWYNSTLNQACTTEVRDLLARLHDEAGGDEES